MLQFIMERNVLLYVLAAACAVGVISQMILKGIYDQLIRDTKNTGEPSGRFLMQLRQRFLYCTHLNEKVGDVPALIKKSLSEYRFWGMGLHQWKRFGLAAFSLALSAAVCGCAILVQNGADLIRDNRYFWLGALVAAPLDSSRRDFRYRIPGNAADGWSDGLSGKQRSCQGLQ